jgi:hypothetical protein
MREERLRRELEALRPPGEEEARERGWRVIRAAFAAREPIARRRPLLRPALVLAALAALVAAALSPPGRAVLDGVRAAIGVERSAPALFSLPAPGRLLVTSGAGAWVVAEDGSRRRLGPYREAAWSPFGRFVVAARERELAALEPGGTVRWALARPGVRFPRWTGTETDTRIAYLARGRLRLVAGDGTGDAAPVLPAAAAVAPAWRPGGGNVLAYVTADGRVLVYEAGAAAPRWRSRPYAHPRSLAWSPDGGRLALVTRDRLVLFGAERPEPLATRPVRGVVDAAFAPRGRTLALARAREVLLLDADRPRARPERVLAGAGRFGGIAWSPDGRWLLVSWPDADQWVFVRAQGGRRLQAVSNMSEQFEGGFPAPAGWCCPAS